jgi:hypothetical protein
MRPQPEVDLTRQVDHAISSVNTILQVCIATATGSVTRCFTRGEIRKSFVLSVKQLLNVLPSYSTSFAMSALRVIVANEPPMAYLTAQSPATVSSPYFADRSVTKRD